MLACAKCGAQNPPATRFCGGCGATLLDAGPVPVGSAPLGEARSSITVGSADDCDRVLKDPTISGHHLKLHATAEPDRFRLEDLGSSNGTYVRGSRVEQAEVGRSETIQLGLRPVTLASLVVGLLPQASSGGARSMILGRTDEADIVLPYPMVSGRHAELRLDGAGLSIRDLGSTNGTFVDGVRAAAWTQLGASSSLALGTYRVPPSSLDEWRLLLVEDPAGAGPSVAQGLLPNTGEVLIGRDPECQIVIDRPQISWRHARITARDGKWVIKDLRSANGTFVNGSRVRMAALQPGDQLQLGSVSVRLEEGRVVAPRRYEGEVRLDAEDLSRILTLERDRTLTILDGVSVSIYPGELVALMGPSGAGKTTLLEMLTGLQQPNIGRVLFNGRDLHTHAEELSDQIGYVPQDDVMHRDLTVFEVLYHAAVSRLPADLPEPALIAEVEQLLTTMGLAHIKNNHIGGTGTRWRGISGGQRKRVNIALELITEPPLLFLDEPTSGLASSDTLEVLQVLRNLADRGTTIVMTIHQPRVEAYRLVDQLLLLTKGGKLAYFGPADPEAADHFQARSRLAMSAGSNPADYVMDALEPGDESLRHSPEHWQQQFRDSPIHEDFVTKRRGSGDQVALSPSGTAAKQTRSSLHQFSNLFARYRKRKLRDHTSMAIQMAQAPIIALLVGVLFLDEQFPGKDLLPPHFPYYIPLSGVHVSLFLLAAAAFWFGCSNVARELVADRPVFKRERRGGLPVAPYLASVFMFQVGVAAVQTLVMVFVVGSMVGLQANGMQVWLVLFLAAASGVGLGLLVSALAPTEVTAISIIPLILLPQLMLSGYLQLYRHMSDGLQGLSRIIPVRWAFEALACLEVDARQSRSYRFDVRDVYGFPLAESSSLGQWAVGGSYLLSFAVLFLLLTWWRLATMNVSPGD